MDYIFHAVGFLWFLSEVYLSKYVRSKSGDFQKDKHSLRYIWISVSIAVPIAIVFYKYTSFPISTSLFPSYIGLVIILLGAATRWWAVWKLGKFFTTNLAIDEQHVLIDTGLYGLIRHPAYTGCIMSFLGLGLTMNNWPSLFALVTIVSTAFLYRIFLEEKMLEEEMGEVYKHYQSKTKKLLPYIY